MTSDLSDEPDLSMGRRLLLRFINSRNSDEGILMSQLKQQLLRLEPSFSEKELGFSSFKQFIVSLTGDVVEKVVMEENTLPVVFLQHPEEPGQPVQINSKENAAQFLAKKLRYQKKASKRLLMSQALFESLGKKSPLSMNQMFEQVYEAVKPKVAKTDIKKYINTLFTGGAFSATQKHANGPLLSRPFKLDDTIQSPEGLDTIYIRRVSEILQSRYTDLEATEILELLI